MARFPRQYRLVSLLIGTLAIAVLALVFMPIWLTARRVERLGSALRAWGIITQAENDLAGNDLDGNGLRDYWCRDVRGLANIRSRGTTAGLIDDRLAGADDAYQDVRDVYGHIFKMIELDEDDRPLAGPSGFGPEYGVCMYSAREGEFQDTFMTGRDGQPWRLSNGRRPLRKLLRFPASEGWCKFCS
ncbi:MAG TPA: hypothetical protein VJU16_05390 [Planctomycetota bacterium]|nr:hypothetical protein [Planctomycetota bacterium]